MNLGQYEVLCRLATDEGVSPPVSAVTLGPPASTGLATRVQRRSSQRYGRKLADIEAEILKRRQPLAEPTPRKRARLGGTTWE